jgi:hypothetical protein
LRGLTGDIALDCTFVNARRTGWLFFLICGIWAGGGGVLGAATVSVVCDARKSAESPAKVTVGCDKPITLKVMAGGHERTFALKAGVHSLVVGI